MSETTIHYGNISEYLGLKSRLSKIPFSGTFELTPRCNMNCKMCYIRMTPEEMVHVGQELSVNEWLRIAQEAVDQGMIMLLLTGGEPILYQGFKELYLQLRKMGLFISINSNGTMLNEEWLEFFKEHPPAKFNITLYGGSNETYERLCGNPKGFDQVKSTIENLQKNNIEVLLNCTISKENGDDLPQMVAFAEEHHLHIHATTYNFPPVRKEGVENVAVQRPDTRESAINRIKLNWYTSKNKDTFLSFAKNICNEDYSQLSDAEFRCETEEGEGITCAAGRSNFWITWDGRILPCGMIPDASICIKHFTFKEAWDKTTSQAAQVRLPVECKDCKKKSLCAPCAAKLYAETGSYHIKSNYLCEYIDEYIRLLKKAIDYLRTHPHT